MEPKNSDQVTYSILVEDQWKVQWGDISAAFAKPTLGEKFGTLFSIYQHSRIGRAVYRYTYQRGKLAAGGISFMAIFSLAAALTVGWTLFTHFFAINREFQEMVVTAINNMLPGIIDDPATGTEGLIDPSSISIGTGNMVTGIVALVVAVFSASRIVRYIRDGIRSMFGLLAYPKSLLLVYPRYILGLVLLMLTVFATAGLSLASTWLEGLVGEVFNLDTPLSESFTFDVASLAVPFLVNLLTFVPMVRYVADVRPPRKTLWQGAAAFALASAVLQTAGGLILGSSSDPLIVAAATVGTLLLWINILARTALIICAWMADPPAVIAKVRPEEVRADLTPNYVTMSDPESLHWPNHPISGDLIPAIPNQTIHGLMGGAVEGAQDNADIGSCETESGEGTPEKRGPEDTPNRQPTPESVSMNLVHGHISRRELDRILSKQDSEQKEQHQSDSPKHLAQDRDDSVPHGEELGPKKTEWVAET